jgi:hypothetical protein
VIHVTTAGGGTALYWPWEEVQAAFGPPTLRQRATVSARSLRGWIVPVYLRLAGRWRRVRSVREVPERFRKKEKP